MGRGYAAVGLWAGLMLAGAGCKDPKPEIAQRSAREARTEIDQARTGLSALLTNLTPLLEGLAPALATPLAANQEAGTRNALLDMNGRAIDGRNLSFYPTGFVVAVGRDGVAVARNVEHDDLMRGMAIAGMFPSVRTALGGQSALAVGELPAPNLPSKVYAVAAVPVRDAQNNVVGALAAGISYGQLAEAMERAIRTHVGTEPVIWVGLRRNGRVLPSGHDLDVPARWLIPQPLIDQIPRDADARLQSGGGMTSWTFIENDARGWGGALGTAPMLPETSILVYRSEARQQ